ncbi:hypothetical protein [Malonomonas rubra]|uniref:hypothetical protein n=1 Tax=Malonomonas rubra TaxID=57040 RepID=UPI0026F2FFFF|nr:hypothetical protein [Malonomonas rubra]
MEGYAMIRVTMTLPVWGPVLYMYGKNLKTCWERYPSKLPPQVTDCWAAIDNNLKNGWFYDANIKVTLFECSPESEKVYVLKSVGKPSNDEDLSLIDTKVTLYKGGLVFLSQKAEVEVECGIRSGDVVAIRVEPLL